MEKPPKSPEELLFEQHLEEGTLSDLHIETPGENSADHSDDTPRDIDRPFKLTKEMINDPISRRYLVLSTIFAVLALISIVFLTVTFFKKKRAAVTPQEPAHVQVVAPQVITQSLNEFQVMLHGAREQEFRVELVAECSDFETCDYLKEHTVQIHDLLLPVLSHVNPQEFSKLENKKLVRKKLVDRLNSMKLPGQVLQVHFYNLILEDPIK